MKVPFYKDSAYRGVRLERSRLVGAGHSTSIWPSNCSERMDSEVSQHDKEGPQISKAG